MKLTKQRNRELWWILLMLAPLLVIGACLQVWLTGADNKESEQSASAIDWNPDMEVANHTMESREQRRLLSVQHRPHPLKILYVVTTLAEYDEGSRSTARGFDRMQNLMIPVIREGVESLLRNGYQVDVFIVAHYKMTREHLIRQALPESVGLKVWDDASPATYPPDKRDRPDIRVKDNTLGLARQHRIVVKDHLFEYDMFLCFEDDMIIHGSHVENHLDLTQQLYRLRELAPERVDNSALRSSHGPLSKAQLKRMFPGLIRVEALLDEANYGAQDRLDAVPVQPHQPLDPAHCCHISDFCASETRPAAPPSDKLFLWETGIRALGVRELPNIGWVAFQRGPRAREGEFNLTTNDYWSGEDGYFEGDRRPQPNDFSFVNNQGGWMATRQQLWEWHTEICPGGFLPPFDSPHYNYDGLDMRNVEYWSGGLNLVTARHACNLQRIVSLDPNQFAKHLLYHSANNKQRQLHGKRKRFVKIDDLYGQLLTVQQNADRKQKAKDQ